jgi:hypothetical protein
MKQILLLFGILCLSFFSRAQIVINEVDADNPSYDYEEFIELKTDVPNVPLDGYVVVLFNGSNDESYDAFDLDGYSTDANGLFVLGTADVSPSPDLVFSQTNNVIQNGADAVALYQGNASDFPDGTPPTQTNLIDALVYDTNDSDDNGLLTGLGQSVQYNEGANGDKDYHSNQRKDDGTYEAKTPTPGALNSGGGIQLPTVTISTEQTSYTEGETLDITFTISENVSEDLTINFSLVNGSFDETDYSGNLSAIISSGTSTTSSSVTITDDTDNEGNETMVVSFVNLNNAYEAFNDNYSVTIEDNDFEISNYGTPLNPTYSNVSSTAPPDYYSTLDGLSGQALINEIVSIIANSAEVRAQTYGDVWDMLKEADQNPENNNEIWLLYSEMGRAKSEQQGTGTSIGKWNREHIYPQSRGGFTDGTPTYADGIDVYMTTGSSFTEHAHSDGHALRPADTSVNSSRGNEDFGDDSGEYAGPTGNAGSWKGDVARSLFYMALRYDDLSLVAGNPDNTTVGQLGDIEDLLLWDDTDIPDDYEMHRNNVIYQWQRNRNPFIDLPSLADYVFGANQGEVFSLATTINEKVKNELNVSIFPNPATDKITFSGISDNCNVAIYSITGKLILSDHLIRQSLNISNLLPGVYLYKINEGENILSGVFLKE